VNEFVKANSSQKNELFESEVVLHYLGRTGDEEPEYERTNHEEPEEDFS
jgi:hypothetical protein